MKNGYKEDIVVGIFILAFLISVIFMCTCGKNVYDNGHGTDKVRDELTNAQASQRDEATAIRETKQSINRSEAAITNSEQTNREIADTERGDAEIIDECEQVLARVRERQQEETK